MKKVRIGWDNLKEPWILKHDQMADTTKTEILPVMAETYGAPEILRCFVDLKNPKEGLDFLKEASAYAKEILLCVRGGMSGSSDAYQAVLTPVIKEAQVLAPNLTYLEIGDDARGQGVTDADYYACYRGAYHALHQLQSSLKLGGCGVYCLLENAPTWLNFLQNLAQDNDPQKRIDFYSYQDSLQDYPVRIWLMHEAHLSWLKEFSLPTLPIFVTALDLTPKDELLGERYENARNAAVLLNAVIDSSQWPEYRLFFRSVLDETYAYTQFEKRAFGYAKTPNAHAATLLSKLSGDRLDCEVIEESWPPHKDIVATKKDGTVSILFVNPTDEPTYLKFTVADIPYKRVAIREYRVDEKNNQDGSPLHLSDGIYQSPKKIVNSENVEMLGGADTHEVLEGTITCECNLREHGFCLWTFSKYE